MNKSLALPLTLLALGVLVLAGVLLFKPIDTAFGGAFTGTSAYLQYATTTSVGPQAVIRTAIFPENAACKNRVISTPTAAIWISFGDSALGNLSSTTLSATTGFFQATNTTVTYDSGLYGCKQWHGYGTASSTIVVSEF